MMQKFWIVMCNKSDLMANKRHASLEAARAEAERLARKNVGNTFLVFELLGTVAPYNPPVIWEDARTGIDIEHARRVLMQEGERREPYEEAA